MVRLIMGHNVLGARASAEYGARSTERPHRPTRRPEGGTRSTEYHEPKRSCEWFWRARSGTGSQRHGG
ncbi:hypothetical protein LSM04_009331 [Trypanosoma melophagium]|uniref:uncharacterized protein n=1 Tax=Trypanosoma melophagium TaxID=715481 RepID=UPI00351A7EA0|nr:hypothetical protein LSM04_000376 [Trypanosoma melophagium]KAH9600916.1 hypothetical protein LSM04_002832 [Trypanosoma melophagium]KAH9600978.1 hypothetical protein LSM04_004869 [Trypanosoma melophagium]KAH9600998.1 hypothetical protein LSM04_006196 [Trypanosoma melophagium]KAH9601015.1 hypothetical protein LSM04_006618 [Trypanosoma melophagium]